MILVSTGTNGKPFDRLLEGVARLETSERMVVQHGPSMIRRVGAESVDYLSFSAFAELVGLARIIITHGGVGSILLCRSHGHVPIVVPRLAKFGEAVDDHQFAFTRRLDEQGLVRLITDVTKLQDELDGDALVSNAPGPSGSRLAGDIREYLQSVSGLREASSRNF